MIKETKYKGYFVDDNGKVYSAKIKGGNGKIDYNNLRKMAYSNSSNYLTVCISIMENLKQKRIYKQVHRLVYETFNGDIDSDMTVDHINNNSLDNRLCNLQLLTRESNSVKRNMNYHFGNQKIYKIKDNLSNNILEMTTSQIAKFYNISYKQSKRRIFKTKNEYFEVLEQIN